MVEVKDNIDLTFFNKDQIRTIRNTRTKLKLTQFLKDKKKG